MRADLTPQTAVAFIHEARFLWHQRFELAPGVYTPGSNDIGPLLDAALLPDNIDGATVLDIGAA
jgi:hypothetical protein